MELEPAELEPPDSHHVSAAEGWIALGNGEEARQELSRVDDRLRLHPRVLEAWWSLHVHVSDWDAALAVAERERAAFPGEAWGWLHRAYALRRTATGGLQAAWDALRPAYEQHPGEPTIAYNLACYACQLGQLDEARKWLHCAMKIGGVEAIQELALADPDLERLWPELRGRPHE